VIELQSIQVVETRFYIVSGEEPFRHRRDDPKSYMLRPEAMEVEFVNGSWCRTFIWTRRAQTRKNAPPLGSPTTAKYFAYNRDQMPDWARRYIELVAPRST